MNMLFHDEYKSQHCSHILWIKQPPAVFSLYRLFYASFAIYHNSTRYVTARDATIYRYIVYRIVLSLYRCIDTKSNRIVIYRRIVACFNEIIVHCGQLKWYMMLFKEKKHHLFLLKATQNNVLTIEQYIAVSWYIRGNISIRLYTVSLQL